MLASQQPTASCAGPHHTHHWGRAPTRPCRRNAQRRHAAGSTKQQTYTTVDDSSTFSIFTPPLLDISNLLDGQQATAEQVEQVQQECAVTGFLAIRGHGISTDTLQQLFATARQLFDLSYEQKMQLVVKEMKAGRGYEISPEHKAYMQAFQQQQQRHHQHLITSSPEPSAALGILSERFICGPELTPTQQHDPYYCSELGQVYFPPNAWPSTLAAAPELQQLQQLQPQMLACYSQCEAIAAALMRLFAAALGVDQHFFDDKLVGHHSNMQVANYPSQLVDPGPLHLRKKAHVDSGTLTLLASEDWLPGSSWRAGEGGLQLLSPQQEWLEVAVPQGALLVNLGSLMTRWSNTLWKSTLHRVANPPVHKQPDSRRLSMAFFHKPAYNATIEVLPTCYSSSGSSVAGRSSGSSSGSSVAGRSSGSSSGSSGSSNAGCSLGGLTLPEEPLYPPALVGDLTRQGVLHKLKHLPQEEASQAYHAYLASLRSSEQQDH